MTYVVAPRRIPRMSTDYYEVLGVQKDASAQDIKKAFRQIARECHPDVSGGDPAAEERFRKARNAYETLMDPVTRARYDRRGQRRSSGFGANGGSFFDEFYRRTGEQNPGAQRGPHTRRKPKKNDPRNNIGLDDLFNMDFGFGSGSPDAERPSPGPEGAPRGPSPGSDVEIRLDVPVDVAQRGGSVTAVYHRMQRSDSWRPGTGDDGLVRVQDIADVRILPGTREGLVLRERGLGDAGPFGGIYGDLVATVRLVGRASPPPPPRPEPAPRPTARPATSTGDGSDHTLEISVVEALLGGRVELETPAGKVRLTIPPGTSGGTRMRLKGKGAGGEDLYVEVRIRVPRTLDEESRQLIEAFARLNP